MKFLRKHQRNWDDLAKVDPLWAILSEPEKQHGNWEVEKFFETGNKEIQDILNTADMLGYPKAKNSALDFGCGVGRLTRALSKHFDSCTGIDIAENMIHQAKELNKNNTACTFLLNSESNLKIIKDGEFDFIYTNIVLQHISCKKVIFSYIRDFMRVIKQDGLLVFQLPSYLPMKNRLQLRRRLYGWLRGLGISSQFLYEKMNLHPISMNFIKEKTMLKFLDSIGMQVLQVSRSVDFASSMQNRIYFCTCK